MCECVWAKTTPIRGKIATYPHRWRRDAREVEHLDAAQLRLAHLAVQRLDRALVRAVGELLALDQLVEAVRVEWPVAAPCAAFVEIVGPEIADELPLCLVQVDLLDLLGGTALVCRPPRVVVAQLAPRALRQLREQVHRRALVRIPEVHRVVQRAAKRLLLIWRAALLVRLSAVEGALLLEVLEESVSLGALGLGLGRLGRIEERGILLVERRPVPEDAHLGEAHLGVLGHLALEGGGHRGDLLAARVGVWRGVPAEGDGEDGQHAIPVAVAVQTLELLDADEGIGRQLLAPAEHAALAGQLDEVRSPEQLYVVRRKSLPDGVRRRVALARR
mmetsp:Transcript_20458/g.66969  ORF Transcript_20458/g.66969 Transcript_20458/m.66969 type:complete len:332 (+) Transcript_20458:38-1033(+)